LSVDADWDEMAVVARIARAHGNRGEVILNPETDFPEERFRVGAEVLTRREGRVQAVRVTSLRFHRGRPVVGLEGVSTMSDAEALANLELRVPASALRPLPGGAYYEHDLAGCAVETIAGKPVGTVRDLDGAAGNRWLVIDGPGGEVLVPFASAICVAIDVAAGRIVIDPPPGLLEANTGQRDRE
jgi:16S rRNA processing protein RimM